MKRRELLVAAGASAAVAALPIESTAAERLTPPKGGVLVAVVMGPRSVVIDWAGPWEAFSDVMLPSSPGDMKFGFSLAMVSDETKPLAGDAIITPKYTYETFPSQPNVIVIGAQQEHTPAKIDWIKNAAKNADVVMSVCTGAFLLAKTGLLDGLKATTHHDAYDTFERQFPRVHLVRGPRFVDTGKVASAGGESSGIDLAFHTVNRYYGESIAASAADIMEFNRSSPRPT